jgi:heme o synthase
MSAQSTDKTIQSSIFSTKFNGYKDLMKLRLSSLVVLSAFFGYYIAAGIDGQELKWLKLFYLLLGGVLITGSSNGFNQIWEKNSDKLMERTKNRPLPTKVLSSKEALFFNLVTGLTGLYLLYSINLKSVFLGLIAMILYTIVYTPLKKITPFAVFVGAIPGSIPPLLGYVAFKNDFDLTAGILFLVQFFWQFPHFWALAWRLDDDYKKAGFRLLPSGEKDKKSAFQIMLYSAFLVPVSMLPWAAEITGCPEAQSTTGLINNFICNWSMYFGVAISLVMYYPAVKLYFTLEAKYASRLMFYSFVYLPLIFTIYCFDL